MERIYLNIKRSGVINIIIGAGAIITGVVLIAFGTKVVDECSKLTF